MSHLNWDAGEMLDAYIYDYLTKRQLHASAKAFQAEGNVSTDPVVIDAPSGFLFEWWSVFWDIHIARTDEKRSEAATFYNKSQQSKDREMRKRQEQEHQSPYQNQQMQIQYSLQKHAQQQQHRSGTQLVSGSASSPISNDPSMRQNEATSNAMATKMYEDRLKLPLQRNVLDHAAIKKVDGNVGQLLDPNHTFLLNAAATTTGGHSTGQTLLSAPSILQGNLQQIQNQNQQLPGCTQDMNAMMSSQAVVPQGSFIGVHGSNQGGSNSTLKGWPLAGLDQLCSGLLPQNNLMQSPQSFNQLMLQTQQNLVSPSVSDFESRRFGVLLNQKMGLGKDGQLNSVGDLIPNVGTPAHIGSPMLPHPDSDMSLKQQVQKSSQQLQQYSTQRTGSSQQPESLQQQEEFGSSSLPRNDQASECQIAKKRKLASSSGPANSPGTANTTGPSTGSPSTPSSHAAGDEMTMPTLQQNVPSSKSMHMFGTDGLGSLTSAQNQLVRCFDIIF